jgi:hypothetical protein
VHLSSKLLIREELSDPDLLSILLIVEKLHPHSKWASYLS